jgi:hypothetical protein
MALIAPSLLAADFARLGEALHTIKAVGAPMLHLEVMDGHFVEEITVGQPVVRSLRKATNLVLDLHLLIERPERYVAEFVELGADRVSVHLEATTRLHRVLEQIRKLGAKAGVALNPATPIETIVDLVGEFDYLSVPDQWRKCERRHFCVTSGARILPFKSKAESAPSTWRNLLKQAQTSWWPVQPSLIAMTQRHA